MDRQDRETPAAPKEDIDPRQMEDLYRAFEQADYILMKKYQHELFQYPVCGLPDGLQNSADAPYQNFQLFQIDRIVYDWNENTLDKLTTVYNTLSAYPNSAVVTLLVSDGTGLQLFCGAAYRSERPDTAQLGDRYGALRTAMVSNFPGLSIRSVYVDGDGRTPRKKQNQFETNAMLMDHVFRNAEVVSAVSGVAARRNDKTLKNEEYVQGLEKLAESMRGKKCSALWIADLVSTVEVEQICAAYEDIASQLYPFLQSQQTINRSKGSTETNSLIKGVTDTTNSSVSHSTNRGTTTGTFSSHSIGGGIGGGIQFKPPIIAGANVNVNVNYNHAWGKNKAENEGSSNTNTSGTAKSLTEQNSVAKALSVTDSDGVTLTFQNRAVKTLLDRIDEQIQRLRACEDYGVYEVGAYFIAPDMADAVSAASTYQALIRGDKSSVEASAVNTWSGDQAKHAMEFLKHMLPPQIAIPSEDERGWRPVTPTSLVSGQELAIHIGLPKKSIPGVAVLNCAEFGREVITYRPESGQTLTLGNVLHMHRSEDRPVNLDIDRLTAHAFITGSTGSGKSNTVYLLLNRIIQQRRDAHFLVIEPAKGEYKDVFGGRRDVFVYGTNPKKTQLLRLNPFSFPADVHVLEHIDRLVEVFNACWPMYAAMPAVLKDAIEASYLSCGWSLVRSECVSKRFPTFADLLQQLPEVMRNSDYSKDTKGDYTGALVTRAKSLTNGINGQIFCSGSELADEDLFDQNVIVDLSRVGSMETKALLMGVLMIKLQEHRMAGGSGSDTKLRHVTVLEEAHNLLRRTSAEQSQESGNLQGKSVEMLANAIAEMRTYGEGFLIADQAPGLLDMAVIRNTNTKIILRLPDESDRQLVGKAAGLRDDQIVELARLDRGVAAVFQNQWLEPVLCQVDQFPSADKQPMKAPPPPPDCDPEIETLFHWVLHGQKDGRELSQEAVDRLTIWIERTDLKTVQRKHLLGVLLNKQELSVPDRDELIYCMVKGWNLLPSVINMSDPGMACAMMDRRIADMFQVSDQTAEEIRVLTVNYAADRTNGDRTPYQKLLERSAW